jgi:hypothetical protein
MLAIERDAEQRRRDEERRREGDLKRRGECGAAAGERERDRLRQVADRRAPTIGTRQINQLQSGTAPPLKM